MRSNIHLTLVATVAVLSIAMPALANSTTDSASVPTFFKDVLPVLQQNCQVCHRPGGANLGGMVAPMSFTTYESTRPWAKSIARQVEAKTMPPWHAAPELHGTFSNERTLEEAEIATLVSWAKAGAPVGDAVDAPPAREWPETSGWSIGTPDLVIDMGQRYFVEDDVVDQYITFTTTITKDMLPKSRWVRGVEFRPGGPVVHHIIARPLGGIAPGNDATFYNEGFGTLLEPGTEINWQMHYHKEPGAGTGSWDFSQAALKFYPEGYTPDYIVVTDPMTRFDFEIPPGDANYQAKVSSTFERDSLLLGYTPHMHLRGKSAHYLAKYPDGSEEVLLDVPRYDFNWQTHYEYPKSGKRIPAGTVVELTMTWDNSPDNPSNPDPTATVSFGQPTTSEMMFGFITYADAVPGYVPEPGGGFLGARSEQSEERLKAMLKERFNLDWDTLSAEERQQVLERVRKARATGQAGVGEGH